MAWRYVLTLYDHLGGAVALNLLWLLTVVPWMVAGGAVAWLAHTTGQALGQPGLVLAGVAAAVALVALSPPSFLVVAVTRGWLAEGQQGLRAAWEQARCLALRVQALGAAAAVAVLILVGNALFYQMRGGWVGLTLCGVMLWFVVGVLLMGVHILPLLAAHPEATSWRTVRDAALLVLDRPGTSVAVLAGAVVGLALAVLSGVGLVLGGVPAIALLCNLGLRQLLVRYGGPPLEPDHRNWHDLLYPWRD